MKKTRIEVKANIIAQADAWEATRLIADDYCNVTINMADNNDEANIDSVNVDLLEFGVQTKNLLAVSVQETCHRWAVEDYINSNEINVIISLIMNLGIENANYIEDFLLIHFCQVAEFDCPDIGNINNINENIVSLQQDIICQSSQLSEKKMDTDYTQNQSTQLSR